MSNSKLVDFRVKCEVLNFPARKMLACVNERSPKALQKFNCDKVVFKNVHKNYKLYQKFSVEYILTPKTETSSKDYVGIYLRDWKDLTEVVAFENAITPPSEEPSLYRCIEFDCRPHLCKVIPNQDYQFVYVSQYCDVLGRSNYFQFKSEKEREVSWNDNPESSKDNVPKGNLQNVESISLTPEEIAYNQCFFRDELIDVSKMSVDPNLLSELTTKPVDIASTLQFTPQEASVQASESNGALNLKRGRPLVKTRESGFSEIQNIPMPLPPPPQHQQNSFVNKNFYINFNNGHTSHPIQRLPCPPPYYVDGINQPSKNHWSPWIDHNRQGRWKCEHDSSAPNKSIPFFHPVKNETKRGAIPKRCPKCRAPPDFVHQQQFMQHELDQARDEIRDLKAEIERLKHAMELAKAGQAKLRVSAEMARKEGRYAMTFLNNLMFSLINQYRTKIVNFDNTVMYVTREIQSPGWLVPRNNMQTLVCGRPSIVKMVGGRDKELKAIIGQQELKIRDLHSRLVMANKIIDRANLLNLKLEFCDSEVGQILDTPQLTPQLDDSPGNLSVLDKSICNSSSFDLADLGQVFNNIEDKHTADGSSSIELEESGLNIISTLADVHCSNPTKTESIPSKASLTLEHTAGWEGSMAEQPNHCPSDITQFGDRDVIWDNKRHVDSVCVSSNSLSCKPNETNNNTINTNCKEEASDKSECGVCNVSADGIK